MARKFIVCDGCGEQDDWVMDEVPIFTDGLVLKFRSDSGGCEFEAELEFCCGCKWKILELGLFDTALARLDEIGIRCSLRDPRIETSGVT